MNTERFQEHSDYLLMLNSPDYGNLASPQKPDYVNDIIFTECLNEPQPESSGYLVMRPPGEIFSPTPQEATAFNFETHKKQKTNGEPATGTELVPMLRLDSDLSDGENSPTVPKSFSNPSYQKGLTITEPKEIVKTADNYINMPQQKVLINDKKTLADLISSDVQNDKIIDIENKNYVNSQSRDWERPYLS